MKIFKNMEKHKFDTNYRGGSLEIPWESKNDAENMFSFPHKKGRVDWGVNYILFKPHFCILIFLAFDNFGANF